MKGDLATVCIEVLSAGARNVNKSRRQDRTSPSIRSQELTKMDLDQHQR
jgi:hypothetical protein